MEQISGYLFPFIWGCLGVYLIYMGKKINSFCYYLSTLFFFMCGWYLANHLIPETDLFSGIWGLVFRIAVAVFLIIGAIIYFLKVKKDNRTDDKKE